MTLDIQGDLDIFFQTDEFAVECTLPDSSKVNVLKFDADQESFAGFVVSADCKIHGKTDDLEDLNEGDQVVISSVTYFVKKNMKVEDGLVSDVYLSK